MRTVGFQTLFTHNDTIITVLSEERLTYNSCAVSPEADVIKRLLTYKAPTQTMPGDSFKYVVTIVWIELLSSIDLSCFPHIYSKIGICSTWRGLIIKIRIKSRKSLSPRTANFGYFWEAPSLLRAWVALKLLGGPERTQTCSVWQSESLWVRRCSDVVL